MNVTTTAPHPYECKYFEDFPIAPEMRDGEKYTVKLVSCFLDQEVSKKISVSNNAYHSAEKLRASLDKEPSILGYVTPEPLYLAQNENGWYLFTKVLVRIS